MGENNRLCFQGKVVKVVNHEEGPVEFTIERPNGIRIKIADQATKVQRAEGVINLEDYKWHTYEHSYRLADFVISEWAHGKIIQETPVPLQHRLKWDHAVAYEKSIVYLLKKEIILIPDISQKERIRITSGTYQLEIEDLTSSRAELQVLNSSHVLFADNGILGIFNRVTEEVTTIKNWGNDDLGFNPSAGILSRGYILMFDDRGDRSVESGRMGQIFVYDLHLLLLETIEFPMPAEETHMTFYRNDIMIIDTPNSPFTYLLI